MFAIRQITISSILAKTLAVLLYLKGNIDFISNAATILIDCETYQCTNVSTCFGIVFEGKILADSGRGNFLKFFNF